MLRVDYRWQDPNTVPVLERHGDRLVVDGSVEARQLRYTALVDRQLLAQAISSFGIPEAWMEISYSSAAELAQKERDRDRRAAARGIVPVDGGDALGVDFRWVVAHSTPHVRPAVEGLRTVARDSGYQDVRGFIGVLASFVQSMTYRVPSSTRRAADGTTVYTGGVTMPLETLANGWGDCDTKSLLFASLLANVRDQQVAFLRGEGHVLVAFQGAPQPGDAFVRIQGVSFVVAELTSPWRLGMVPEDVWRGLERRRFQVVRVTG